MLGLKVALLCPASGFLLNMHKLPGPSRRMGNSFSLPCSGRELQEERVKGGKAAGPGPAALGPIFVVLISYLQLVLPVPLGCGRPQSGREWGRETIWALPKIRGYTKQKVPQQLCPAPTVLTSPLFCVQRADLHFLCGAQRPPWGHEAHRRSAEEAVGSAQGWRTEPARPRQGQCPAHGQGLHGTLQWRQKGDQRLIWLPKVRACVGFS